MAENKNEKAEQIKSDLDAETNMQEAAADTCGNAEKTVTIRIPRTKENSGDVFVSVNERSWLIQRGVPVEVPECVAEVLRHQEEMLEEAYTFEEKASRK